MKGAWIVSLAWLVAALVLATPVAMAQQEGGAKASDSVWSGVHTAA